MANPLSATIKINNSNGQQNHRSTHRTVRPCESSRPSRVAFLIIPNDVDLVIRSALALAHADPIRSAMDELRRIGEVACQRCRLKSHFHGECGLPPSLWRDRGYQER